MNIKKYSKYHEDYSEALSRIAEQLDISPSDYKLISNRYSAVGQYLQDDEEVNGEILVYPQGSFALGTITRPCVDDKEGEYDVDVVCQYPFTGRVSAEQTKKKCGDRLRSDANYRRMLEAEGKRCWTLTYADENPGFHIDTLPVIPREGIAISEVEGYGVSPEIARSGVYLTDRRSGGYEYGPTNPAGFSEWFKYQQYNVSSGLSKQQKESISRDFPRSFPRPADVPDALVRTPLQRSIQILKGHRDRRFSGHEWSEYKPISMIITTLSARLYDGEQDVYTALRNIVEGLRNYTGLLGGQPLGGRARQSTNQLIRRTADGKWSIQNPVEPNENFADKWHEEGHVRARAFFDWVNWVYNDFFVDDVTERLPRIFGSKMFDRAIAGTLLAGAENVSSADFPEVHIPRGNVEKPWTE